MERSDLQQILQEYDVGTVVFLDEEPSRPRAFVVGAADDGWLVHRTDKQDIVVPGSERSFATEPDALAYVVAVLRDEAGAHRRQVEAAAASRHRERLPPAKPALKKLRATLEEIRQFLLAHHVPPGAGNLAALAQLAATDDADAADLMLAAARLHRGMLQVPRDGWRDVYVATPAGTLDRKATAQLDQLKQRLARQLEPWKEA